MPDESFDYLSVVGSLIHFTNFMRPDISFAVSALSRHSLDPGKAHVRAARRVIMYLYEHRRATVAVSLLSIATLVSRQNDSAPAGTRCKP